MVQTTTRVVAESGERGAAYVRVEGLHLRQWLARAAAPVAVLCTNGAGLLDVAWLPAHDAPLRLLGLPPVTSVVLRTIGLALVPAAAWLRVASKGVLVRRTTLTTGGIYARVRHPFYLAALLGGSGTLVLAGGLGAVAAVVWMLLAVPVYGITVAGEEEGLGTLYPDAWADYAARVPALLPRPGHRAAGAPARITFANLVAEHEPPRLLRFLGGAAVVCGVAAGGAGGVVLVGIGLLAFVLSRALPGLRPPRRG